MNLCHPLRSISEFSNVSQCCISNYLSWALGNSWAQTEKKREKASSCTTGVQAEYSEKTSSLGEWSRIGTGSLEQQSPHPWKHSNKWVHVSLLDMVWWVWWVWWFWFKGWTSWSERFFPALIFYGSTKDQTSSLTRKIWSRRASPLTVLVKMRCWRGHGLRTALLWCVILFQCHPKVSQEMRDKWKCSCL